MKVNVKKLPKSQIEIEVELTGKEFDHFINLAVLNLSKDLKVSGFRPGKIPPAIVEEKVGKNNILNTAAQLAVEETYKKVILENELEPILKPEITILKLAPGNSFIFRVKTTILPQIELGDYKKIAASIKKREVFVTKEEIENTLDFLQKSRAKFIPLSRPAKEGDYVEIEYESPDIDLTQYIRHSLKFGKESSSDEEKKPSRIKDAFILGKGKLIPGFEAELVGMKENQEKKFSLIFPQNSFWKNLANKRINFKVKMISVQKIELPEITEEFVKKLGNFKNLEDLKRSIKEGLKMEKEIEEQRRIRTEILERTEEVSKFEIPELLIDLEKERLVENLKVKVKEELKIPFEKYLEAINISNDELKEKFLKEAEKRIKNFLILKEIGKREKISVSEKEIEDEMNRVIKNYPPENLEKLDFSQLKEYSKDILYNEKVFQRLESFLK